eukprot:4733836-Pleurochrysis_carterae.AAC.3
MISAPKKTAIVHTHKTSQRHGTVAVRLAAAHTAITGTCTPALGATASSARPRLQLSRKCAPQTFICKESHIFRSGLVC